MNQPPDVPSSEKQAEQELGRGHTPEQFPASSPPGDVPPEWTDIFATAEGGATDQSAEPAIPVASDLQEEAIVELGAPPAGETGYTTSPSIHPIRPVSGWAAGAESFVGTQGQADSPSSASDNLPVAEELPLASDVVAEDAIDPNAVALPLGEVDAPLTPPSEASPAAAHEQGEPASAASLAAAPSANEVSSDIHAATPPPGPAAESSNLFGPFLTPFDMEGSNIHAQRPTAWSEGEDSALSFLGGIPRPSAGSTSPPPLAEDLPGSSIQPPADAPDYGAAPLPVPEASNILADLMQAGHHSSAVHIPNPGVGRTLRPGSSTESGFDIDVDLGPVPKELEEAEKAATPDNLEFPHRRPTLSETTIPEMYIEDPQEHILSAVPPPSHDPSSIFDADFDPQAATALFGDAPESPGSPLAAKPTDSGIIEWSVDEAPVTTPSSDLFSGEAVAPAGPRSAVIKPSSSATLPRPTPQEVAAESAATSAPGGITIPSSLAGQQREVETVLRQPISPAPSRLGAWLGGTLLGLSLPLGVGAALYFTGVINPATSNIRTPDTDQRLTALATELTQAQQQLQQTQKELQTTQQQLTQAQETARLKEDEQQRLAQQLQQTSQQFQQVQTQLRQAEQTLQTTIAARKQLETEREQLAKNLSKAQDDLRSAVIRREEVEKQLQQAGDQRKKLEADLNQLREQTQKLDKELQAGLTQRQNLEKQVQQFQEQLQALAKELQAARLLTEQYDPATLLAAQRRAIALLNTKPELQQLRQLEEEKRTLTATIQRLQQQVQQQSEAFAKERRTLEEQAAAEQKRLREQLQAAAQKREQELQTQLRQTQQHQESLRQKLAQAPSDTELLQLWLQLLAEARRPTDAAAAQQAARKVLQRVDKDSEEAAQAHVLLALAAILTNQSAEASLHLEQAQQSPAYEPARQAQRSWVAIAEQARLAIRDPLAPLRRPPQEQPKDPQLALSHLHQAIQAYRQGRFPQAIQAAEQALLHDPSDPVAWYYLGAARWMLGQRDRAADDFRQGGSRERNSRFSYRELSNLLSPIQGPVREVLEVARP
jgi:hypothetical protein